MFLIISIINIYLVWILIEILFLFFILYVFTKEQKRVGLVVYFFFQSVTSLILFIRIVFFLDKVVILLLVAKLGIFPFFYWFVVVSVKLGVVGNIFVLSLQKVSVFWLIWLLYKMSLEFLYVLVYLGLFFVVVNLLLISDF